MNPKFLLLLIPVLLLAVPTAAAADGHYVPQAGDRFHYYETVVLNGGTGNYTGYTENTFVNGTVGVTSVATNGTESASYANTVSWMDNQGDSEAWAAAGDFTFSANTFLYVQGTDNQTGYTNPYVWFYMDNTLGVGASFTILNTPMTVVSTDASYPSASSSTGYVSAILAQGSGSYQRNDDYGVFTATFTWQEYFDPSTGYIIGYVYTEQDSDGAGDGFTITDQLSETSTTYPLTEASAPPPSSSPSGLTETELIVLVLVVVVIIVVILVVVLSRRRSPLPKHSARGNFGYGPPPGIAPTGVAPPISLTPSGQPAVQQVVIRDTVKVNCRYCGTLMDSTATNCPNCGAPRT